MKKMVLFGAGKIGRSFIGQLFSHSGYEVVFVDVCTAVIEELNRRQSYEVIIKHPDRDETLRIDNVRGLLFSERKAVIAELVSCDLAAVSVGQRGLYDVAATIADGISGRYRNGIGPLDLILAENMRNAAGYLSELLSEKLGVDFPYREMVGLVETSIGKMVPVIPADIQSNDPLVVYAEPYNTLIIDRKGFLNPVPDVKGLAPKDNIKAWVDRKSYIHNFGHAAAAYAGYCRYPESIYIWEVLEDPVILEFTRAAMVQSAGVLKAKYPEEFTLEALSEHIDNLLARFRNRALGDTIYRVGCDLGRKLSRNDRILSPLLDGIEADLPVDDIARVFVYGLGFGARDGSGNTMTTDMEFAERLQSEGLIGILEDICGLKAGDDDGAINIIMKIRTENERNHKTFSK